MFFGENENSCELSDKLSNDKLDKLRVLILFSPIFIFYLSSMSSVKRFWDIRFLFKAKDIKALNKRFLCWNKRIIK